jgi:hypothetical protein
MSDAEANAEEIQSIKTKIDELAGARITMGALITELTDKSAIANAQALTIDSTMANIEADIRLSE